MERTNKTQEEKEARRIVRVENSTNLFCRRYQALKPSRFERVDGSGGWEARGRGYTIRGLHGLVRSGKFDLEFENGIEEDLEEYERMRREAYRAYLNRRRLRDRRKGIEERV